MGDVWRGIQERRKHRRVLLTLDVSVHVLPLLEEEAPALEDIAGQTHDVSDSGVSLVTNQRLTPSSLVLCKITLPFAAATIPTLSQVKWSSKHDLDRMYISGIQFVI